MKVEDHCYNELTGIYSETAQDSAGITYGLKWNIDYWSESAKQELLHRNNLSKLGFEFEMYYGAPAIGWNS